MPPPPIYRDTPSSSDYARQDVHIHEGTCRGGVRKTRRQSDVLLQRGGLDRTRHYDEPGARNDLVEMKEDFRLKMSHSDLLDKYGERYIRHRRAIKDHVADETNDACLSNMQEAFQHPDIQLRPWQRHTMMLLEHQTDREILFVVDEEGNKGKTWLAKYIRANQNAIYITITGMGDVMYGLGYVLG